MIPQPYITLTDVLGNHTKSVLSSLYTVIPGIIEDYDATGPSATIKLSIRRVFSDGSSLPSVPIYKVPVCFPRSQDAAISWPLRSGDSVLVLFSQRSLDDWANGSDDTAPLDPRTFDINDAIALPGIFPFSQGKACDSINLCIQFKDQKISIAPSGEINVGESGQFLITKGWLDLVFTNHVHATVGAIPTPIPDPSQVSITQKVKAQ